MRRPTARRTAPLARGPSDGKDQGVDDVTIDLLIIGAGPTGLYSAYYAGFRGMSVAVVDSLPELGGQITAMYPE